MNIAGHSAALAPPVRKYLEALEVELKQLFGVSPEGALCDVREMLQDRFESLGRTEPGLDEEAIYRHFVATLGAPKDVAKSYQGAGGSTVQREIGYAPGWRISCTRCGRSAPAGAAGIIRIGGLAWHKYTLGWCSGCRRSRWLRVSKDLDRTNLTEALGPTNSPEEVWRRLHKPWVVLFLILAAVLLCVLAVPRLIGLFSVIASTGA